MLHLLIRHLPCVDVGKEVTSADESLLYDVQMSLSIYSVPALLIFQAVGAGVGGYVPQRPRNCVRCRFGRNCSSTLLLLRGGKPTQTSNTNK